MKAAILSLLALQMLANAQPVLAKAAASDPAGAQPIGSPGAWISTNDYPATALRYRMTGITFFRLTVDAAGVPSRCAITESSGFDVLDNATCQRIMEKARFSPARDRAGRPVEGAYANRVRWILPEGGTAPLSESFASISVSIEKTGNITSCRGLLHVPIEMEADEELCAQAIYSNPSSTVLEFMGEINGPSADFEIQMADVFTPTLRTRVLASTPGYQQRALSIHRFSVTRDGKIDQCTYEEQRGSERLTLDFCGQASRTTFDPPFSAFDKDGIAHGWHIARVLLKAGQ